MNRKSLFKKTRCGAVLPLVVLIVLLLMVIGLGVTSLGMHSRLFAIHSADSITARSATDAAVSDAIFEMNEKLKVKPWNDSSLPAASDVALLNSDATYDYVVTENNDIYTVEGTGRALNHVHTINSALRLSSFFDYALFTRGTIELKNCSNVGWINNHPDDWPLQVGTMSTASNAVTLMNSSVVNGDVLVGVGGDPDVVINGKTGAIITGDTYPLTYPVQLHPVVVPDVVKALPLGATINDPLTITVSGKYPKIDLGNSEALTISGNVTLYITGDVKMGNSAVININPGSSLVMYVGGNFDGSNSAGFNNLTANAQNLGLYCLSTCKQVLFKNSSNFYGAIYAPDAAITLDNTADVYGSIVGNSFILKNSGKLMYDAAFRHRSVDDIGVRFAISRWSEQ